MALNQAQWFAKISKFVPSWYFENKEDAECFTSAVFQATAAMFSQIQGDTDSQQDATFITHSVAPVIDLLGDERNIDRLVGESDAAYGSRIQNGLFLNVGLLQIMAVVNAALNNGTGVFIENQEYGFYDDPDVTEAPGFLYFDDYYSRWISTTKTYNWWTLILPEQFEGVIATILAAVVAGIESNKALGTTYDILYENADHPGDTDYILTEDGDRIITEDGSGLVTEG